MAITKFFFCVILITVTVIVTSANHNRHRRWKEHSSVVRRFKCNHPHLRFIPFRDLINEDYSIYKAVTPHGTVLHRCEFAGCCPGNTNCEPIKQENVTLVFLGIDERNNAKYFEITAVNHIHCGCQN